MLNFVKQDNLGEGLDLFPLPPRLLFVRDLLLQQSFGLPKDQTGDGTVAVFHA